MRRQRGDIKEKAINIKMSSKPQYVFLKLTFLYFLNHFTFRTYLLIA